MNVSWMLCFPAVDQVVIIGVLFTEHRKNHNHTDLELACNDQNESLIICLRWGRAWIGILLWWVRSRVGFCASVS